MTYIEYSIILLLYIFLFRGTSGVCITPVENDWFDVRPGDLTCRGCLDVVKRGETHLVFLLFRLPSIGGMSYLPHSYGSLAKWYRLVSITS